MFLWNLWVLLRDCSWSFLLFFPFFVCDSKVWSSLSFKFSSLFAILSSSYTHSSCTHSSHNILNLVNFLLAHTPLLKESHSLGKPFKVVITIFSSSTMSLIDSNFYLIWYTLVKYDCMVSSFCIFTFLSWFLKIIFPLIFLPSNRLDSVANNFFGFFIEYTWGIKLSLMEYTMILLDLIISFLFFDLA